jgi:hypothetical protein
MGKELRDVLSEAQAKGFAVGHFNVSDIAILKAVLGAARDMKTAVIVGVSEGERTYLGTRQIAAVIHSLRSEFDVPIFLNADHTHSLTSAIEAAEAGFDSIVFDISALPRASIPQSSSRARSVTSGPGRRSMRPRPRRAVHSPLLTRPDSSCRRPVLTRSLRRSVIGTACHAAWSTDRAASTSTLRGSPRSRQLRIASLPCTEGLERAMRIWSAPSVPASTSSTSIRNCGSLGDVASRRVLPRTAAKSCLTRSFHARLRLWRAS